MKNFWKRNTYDAITDVADYQLQQRAWFGKAPGVVLDYVETFATLFDDCFFEKFIADTIWDALSATPCARLHPALIHLHELMTNYVKPGNDG